VHIKAIANLYINASETTHEPGRLGDTATHPGTIITACAKTYCEGALVARVDIFDRGLHGPHPIVTGSPAAYIEGTQSRAMAISPNAAQA
jgi:uncharacterized Zn-binding protein involved in type VI secretion